MRFYRTLISLVVMLHISGCGTYHNARLPHNSTESERANWGLTIKEGSNVRITLDSGQVFHGKISKIDEETVALIENGNYGYGTEEFQVSEIAKVEMLDKPMSDGMIEGAWFVGILVGIVVGVLYGLSHTGMN